jgi:hypothetical protein
LNIHLSKGSKITVSKKSIKNGYEPAVTHARKYLNIGHVYTVKSVSVSDCTSSVKIEEIPNQIFNSLSFINLKKPMGKETKTDYKTDWEWEEYNEAENELKWKGYMHAN